MKKNNQPVSKWTLGLYGACAVLWTVRAIVETIQRTYQENGFWYGLNLLCAVLWCVAFAVNLKRYRDGEKP